MSMTVVFISSNAMISHICCCMWMTCRLLREIRRIQKLKAQLKEKFDIKDLGEAKKILGMEISRDYNTCKLWLFQENYVIKMLEMFNMAEARLITTPLAGHFRLSSSQCPNSQEDEDEISRVPYASVVGSLMYAMVCTNLT